MKKMILIASMLFMVFAYTTNNENANIINNIDVVSETNIEM